jgi:hypothetical protein
MPSSPFTLAAQLVTLLPAARIPEPVLAVALQAEMAEAPERVEMP